MAQTILYIEDNIDDMLLAWRVLRIRGFHVIWASDGQTGLEMAQDDEPDLILLDIKLPDMHGHEVARRLREDIHSRLFNVPIIAISAGALRGDALNALAAGCDAYMSKPIKIRELRACVKDALQHRRQLIGKF